MRLATFAYVTYSAHKKGKTSFGFLAGIICALTFPIGPIIYFYFVDPSIKKSLQTISFCPKCGYSANKKINICPKCKNSLSLN